MDETKESETHHPLAFPIPGEIERQVATAIDCFHVLRRKFNHTEKRWLAVSLIFRTDLVEGGREHYHSLYPSVIEFLGNKIFANAPPRIEKVCQGIDGGYDRWVNCPLSVLIELRQGSHYEEICTMDCENDARAYSYKYYAPRLSATEDLKRLEEIIRVNIMLKKIRSYKKNRSKKCAVQ